MLWSLVLKSKIQSSWLASPYKTSPEQLAIPRGTPTQGNLAGHTAPPVLSCADWVGSAPLSSQPAPETTGRSERIRDACPHLSHSWPWTLSGRSRWSKACRGAAVAAALLERQGSSRGKSQDAGGEAWGAPLFHTTPWGSQRASWEPVMVVICIIYSPRGVFPE